MPDLALVPAALSLALRDNCYELLLPLALTIAAEAVASRPCLFFTWSFWRSIDVFWVKVICFTMLFYYCW